MSRIAAIAFLPRQRGYLAPWAPVFLAVGIAAYLGLRAEPSPQAWRAVALGLAAGAGALAAGLWRVPLAWALWLGLLGFALAGARTHAVAAPVLEFRYYGAVEGRVIAIDRSASDKPRLTLDRVVLERMPPDAVPSRVRVSLHGDIGWHAPRIGDRVMTTAHLSRPEGPVEPGGFDFQRMAWFRGIGAVGYTRTPVLLARASETGLAVQRLRDRLGRAVRARLDGETGAVAAALVVGDRGGIGAATLETLRATNLAHLLAISGLHVGLLTGLVFWVLRLGLAAVPGLALCHPTKKWAAGGALVAAAGYLAISGAGVATQRAFVMAAIALVAVMLDRRALTLRAVAIAALIVLLLRPEALASPGFQMSFAATAALVAVFRALRDSGGRRWPRWADGMVAVVISSTVAGLATAPVGAAHFNAMSRWGLVANLASVPVMGLVVMPGAVAAGLLSPLGLDWVGLWVMGAGIDWILGVAATVAAWPGAVVSVPSPPKAVLPLLGAGAVTILLWQGRARWAGLVPAMVAFALWAGTPRPDLLIAPSGGLVGLRAEGGRVLSKPRGAGFAARVWLENDGDPVDQETAFARGALPEGIVHAWGRGGEEAARAACRPGLIVVTTAVLEDAGGCLLFDSASLEESGSVALWQSDGGWRVVTARQATGERPWNAREGRAADAAPADQ
ncbi:ComEC family competence protein [Palleronia sediminis]|uniref:ComEC family competence protein n=1 Tax=Palleronia sediminis TaxID=2547833 RepID=A0A4R6AQ12_9RHOB|nr:ComEC/Rec2 family competence protein [Palleronia sediminis]TDL84116.1 ComEC family competence protein [Palleronia sediminis]